jgi:hypothetical protein
MSWTASSIAAPQVPVALQGAILAKALHYDQSLSTKPKIVILAGAGDAGDAAVLVKAFSSLGGTVEIASAADVSSRIKGAGAIYVFPGLLSDAVRTLCVNHRVISLAGNSDEAIAGMASISVGIAGGKPQIIVHLPRSKAEGHKLSSRLLKLARVVQ